jgi:hypothetical protein
MAVDGCGLISLYLRWWRMAGMAESHSTFAIGLKP